MDACAEFKISERLPKGGVKLVVQQAVEGKEKFAKTVVKMGFNPAADVLVKEQGCDLMWWELSQIKGVSVYQLGR